MYCFFFAAAIAGVSLGSIEMKITLKSFPGLYRTISSALVTPSISSEHNIGHW